jgi:hypothetical protein
MLMLFLVSVGGILLYFFFFINVLLFLLCNLSHLTISYFTKFSKDIFILFRKSNYLFFLCYTKCNDNKLRKR